MALYEVEAPDGSVYELEGPDDATDDQIAAFAQQQFGARPSADQAAIDRAHTGYVTPLEGMSDLQRIGAGAGAGASRVVRGVRQGGAMISDLLASGGIDTARGALVTPRSDAVGAEEAQARELEVPLMDTAAGQFGNVLGTAGAFAPTVLLPGANTLAGASLIGGATGFSTTPGSLKERRQAGAGGAVGGPAGILAGRAIGAGSRALGQRAAKAGAEDAGTIAAIREAQEAGFRLPPSEMARSAPGRMVAQTAEWFSGRQAVPAKFSAFNQRRANELVRGDIGLKGRGQITEADIATAKRPHLAVYDEVKKVSDDAKFAVEQWRTTNDQLRKVYKIQNRNPTLEGEKEIERLSGEAESWLSAIESEVTKAGRPVVIQRLTNARRELGKIGTAERAINERGDVIAPDLYNAFDRGAPLSGGMLKVAKFAGAFPRYAQKSTQAGWMAGSPPLAPSLGSGGAFLMGEPVTAAALIAAPYATRAGLMSRPVQAMARPPANSGQMRINIGDMLETEEGRRALSSAGIVSALLASQQ